MRGWDRDRKGKAETEDVVSSIIKSKYLTV